MFGIIKIFILISIIFICTNLGMQKAKTYDNRVLELKKVKNSLEMLKSKMEFTYEPIKELFTEISNIIYENKENIFKETLLYLKENDITQSWCLAVDQNEYLKEEDKDTLKMFGKLLGKTDKSGQINEIIVTSKLIDTQIEKAEFEKNKNYKLFKNLGITIGIGICIILI